MSQYSLEEIGPTIIGRGSDRVHAINTGVITADTVLATMGGRLLGWSMGEATGAAAARVSLFDGSDATGLKVAFLAMPAGVSDNASFFDAGIDIVHGLFLHVITGSVDATVYFRFNLA